MKSSVEKISPTRVTMTVEVPGGTLRVRLLPGLEVELAGPAVLVADGTTELV